MRRTIPLLCASLLTTPAVGCGWLGFEPAGPGDAALADGAVGADGPSLDAGGDGLVARFPMDDDPITSGTVKAEPAQASVACTSPCPGSASDHVVGTGAYLFDGVRVELGPVLDTAAPYTITLWMAPAASLVFGSAVSKPRDLTTVFNEVSLTVGNDAVTYEGARADLIVGPSEAIDLRGAWHHVGLVFDGAARALVVDGVERDRVPGPWERSGLPFAIGADLDFGAFAVGYVGHLDDLRFYQRALTTSEIAAIAADR